MQRWRGYGSVPGGWGRSVVTIGVFDGVHRGHQATIGYAVDQARALGVRSVVVTFDPHPAEVVRPGSHPAVLTEAHRKAELVERLGADALCVIPFTREFSQVPAEAFVHDVLVENLHAALVVVGPNFRFGHRAVGNVDLLERLGRTFGFRVATPPLVSGADLAGSTDLVGSTDLAEGTDLAGGTGSDCTGERVAAPLPGSVPVNGDVVISSTYIRSCVAAGDVTAARIALGRPHRVEGIVVRGDGRGKAIGFPTANLLAGRHAAVPADGVYAAWLVSRGGRYRAAVSVGTNPTFAGQERRVEAYVLDFDGDLYGERLAVDFVRYLRPMERYDTVDELVKQIDLDVARTREILGG